ncbi:MAG: RNA 3'-terminal phosphate cyclase [Candidatus Nanoarchaeia archaeon]
MIELDGSVGGGQILRSALAFSLITGKGFLMNNVRKTRPQPGLKAQHMKCIDAAAALCSNAIVEGNTLGSTTLRFVPGKFKPKSMSFDIETAGSVSLLLQSVLPALVVQKKTVTIEIIGGTDGKWAMPYNYLREVFLPQLGRYGDFTLEMLRRGYFPKGGGRISLKVKPKFTFETVKEAKPFDIIDQGKILQIKGVSHASNRLQDKRVAERQADACTLRLKKFGVPVNIDVEYADTLCAGSGIVVWAICAVGEVDQLNPIRLGGDGLGERGKPAEDVGFEAAEILLKSIDSKAPVDYNLADNLIPYLALFGGRIRVEKVTNHVRTNISTIEHFLGKVFDIDGENGIITRKL